MVLRTDFRRRQKGLTLIEVLVALTILGLALLALAPMFTTAVKSNASAYQLTNTTTLAREKLEELSGYPRSDPRLTIANLKNAAFPTGGTPPTGSNAGPCVDNPAPNMGTYCDNDLPAWINPQTGATAPAGPRPGIAWFPYPFTRTYTIEQFDGTLVTRINREAVGEPPAAYTVKLITVIVRPTSGPFPGLRESRQSLYLRFRDA
jgi:prepilin-type N-terminal cleavage/methylation domain-containing protein